MGSVAYIYFAAVNLAAFVMMGADKRRAQTGQWRIPESTLMTAAVIGGGIGILAGMHVFRHKTRKPKFAVGVPVILAIQAAAILIFAAH